MTVTHTTAPRSRGHATTTRLHRTASGLAIAWSVSTMALGLLWTVSDAGYPWGAGTIGLLPSLDRPLAAWLLVGLSALALCAFVAASVRPSTDLPKPRWPDRLLLGIGIVVTVLVAGAGGLALLGYLPMILGSLVLGSGPDLDLPVLWSSTVSLSNTLGGVALIVTATALRRAALQACTQCGRVPRAPGRSDPAGEGPLQRWVLTAVVVAVLAPLAYAVTRVAWFVGVPLGISPAMLETMGDARWSGLGLATGATVGAILTTGLVSRWGEAFPRWVPRLRGRPVPVGLAVVPALVVAAAVTSAGVSFAFVVLSRDLGPLPGTVADWGAWLPTMLWPLWGVALFIAAMAYRLRRRPPCTRCGSGGRGSSTLRPHL